MAKSRGRTYDIPQHLRDDAYDFAQRRPIITSKSISITMLAPEVRSRLSDGCPVGVYDTGTYGRCQYGAGVRGIYDDGKYGLCVYTT